MAHASLVLSSPLSARPSCQEWERAVACQLAGAPMNLPLPHTLGAQLRLGSGTCTTARRRARAHAQAA